MPGIEQALQATGTTVGDVRGIALALGPGGFSSLRVGVSTAKGLALALGVPLVGVGTLEMEAYPYADTGLPICPLLDVGRGEVAYALFQRRRGRWQRLVEERIASPQELASSISETTLFCGEAAPGLADYLRRALGRRALLVTSYSPLGRLGALAHLGARRLEDGHADNLATLQPLYLRRPSITLPREPVKS